MSLELIGSNERISRFTQWKCHFANISMRYIALFHSCQNGNFQMKKCDVFLIFALKHRSWVHVRTALLRVRLAASDMFEPPVINYWPFQCGGSDVVLCCLFLVSEFRRCFTLSIFIILLVRFGLLSDHLLGNSCPLGWSFVLIIFCLFVI